MRNFLVLLKKDFRMMVSGRFFLAAAGSLLLYTLFIQYIVSGNGLTQLKVLVGELLFIEIAAVRFLEIGSMLLKEKQMGVVRVHAVMPFQKRLFLLSKLTAFLLSDLLFRPEYRSGLPVCSGMASGCPGRCRRYAAVSVPFRCSCMGQV